MRALIRIPAFRLLFAGYATTVFGDRALYVVLGIWTLDLTGSPAAGGLAFGFLAVAGLFAPLAGVIADRFPRRAVLIANDAATAVAVLALLFVRDAGDVWIVYGVALVYGFSNQVGTAARGGFVAGMVPDELLGTANGLLESARSGVRVLAPAIGAGLYALAGGHAVAVLDAATFGVSALCLLALRAPDIERRRGRLGAAELAAGFRHLLGTPALRRVQLTVLAGAAAFGAAEVIPFAVVHDGLDRSAAFLGVLSVCHGAGAIVGGVGAARVMARIGEEAALAAMLLVGGAGMALFAVPSAVCALPASALFGVCLAGTLVAYFTLVMRRTPPELRGRAGAAAEMIASTPYLAAIALTALAVSALDYRLVALAAGAVLAAGALLLRRPVAAEPLPQQA